MQALGKSFERTAYLSYLTLYIVVFSHLSSETTCITAKTELHNPYWSCVSLFAQQHFATLHGLRRQKHMF